MYTGRQVVNARFAALLQPDAVDTPGYGNRLRDVRVMTNSTKLLALPPVLSPARLPFLRSSPQLQSFPSSDNCFPLYFAKRILPTDQRWEASCQGPRYIQLVCHT